jgi:DNA-directed RNA polymerase specialized sigma subunit
LELAVIDGFGKEAARRSRKDLEATKRRDVELYDQWKQGGKKPDDLRPLLSNFRGLIRSKANSWARRADLPSAFVHSEFTDQFINALNTYNPAKGTALGTWVTTNLRKAQRSITKYQDPLRIQENRYYKLGQWDNAMATLEDQLDREPSTREMAEFLGWPEAEAGRMEAEKRKALISSGFEAGDPTAFLPSREAEVLRLIRFELSPEEMQVHDYTRGLSGKPQLRPGEIARKLNMSPSKVTRIRNSIAKKIEDHMKF